MSTPNSVRHQVNRTIAAVDMATHLTTMATTKLGAGATASTIRATAIGTARRLTDDGWADLGRRSGHYANGAVPDRATCAAVTALLEGQRAIDLHPADPFAGLGAA